MDTRSISSYSPATYPPAGEVEGPKMKKPSRRPQLFLALPLALLLCSIGTACSSDSGGPDGSSDLAAAADLSNPSMSDFSATLDLFAAGDLWANADLSHHSDLASGGDLLGGPVPDPPPAMCDMRHAGVTAIQALVHVDEYQGVIHGANGDHEIIYGTITDTIWVFNNAIVDTSNVELALNVHSAKDPSGLPHEVPVAPGDTVQVEGEYIPASTANAHDKKGPAAVIHYAHTPCGFVVIAGTTYR